MNRRTLAIIAGTVILAIALWLVFRPDGATDVPVADEVAEAELPRGVGANRR